jgi:chorismate synthase
MLRFLTAGESHGPGLVTVVEGVPAGLKVTLPGLAAELARRRHGHGRGGRMDLESDDLEILGGVRFGRTLGSPVAIVIRNAEWPEWQEEMSPEPGEASRRLTTPRPGHADLAGMLKYDTHDARDVLERASARETAARVVAGYLAKKLLEAAGVQVLSHVVAIGGVVVPEEVRPGPEDLTVIDESPVRAFDAAASAAMVEEIDRARADDDTLGGVIEVIAYGVPAGVGSHVHWDRRLDAQLAGALMSIPAIKAVEAGDGMAAAGRRGSAAHDEITYEGGFSRKTDRAGGIEGGMSTGEPIRLRAAMKPLATLGRPLGSVDVVSKEATVAFRERSDTCAVPAAGVVAESMVALVLATEMQRMFGGDTVADLVGAVEAYRRRLAAF